VSEAAGPDAAASSKSKVAPSEPAASGEAQAIQAMFQRYRNGYEHLDADEVHAVFPSIDVRQLAAVFKGYVSLRQQIDFSSVQVAPSGKAAVVAAWVTTEPIVRIGRAPAGRHIVTFNLRKLNDSWIIEAAKSS
jgi:hypothetical protein